MRSLLLSILLLCCLEASSQEVKLGISSAHTNRITKLILSPNKQYLATGSYDNTCKLWDWKSEKLLYTFSSSNWVEVFDFDPSSSTIAIDELTEGIRLYDLRTGVLKQTLSLPFNAANDIKFNEDGSQLLVSGTGSIVLIDLKSEKVIRTFEHGYFGYDYLAFSPDFKSIYAYDKTKKLSLKFDVETGEFKEKVLYPFSKPAAKSTSSSMYPSLCTDKEGKYILDHDGTDFNKVKIYNLENGALAHEVKLTEKYGEYQVNPSASLFLIRNARHIQVLNRTGEELLEITLNDNFKKYNFISDDLFALVYEENKVMRTEIFQVSTGKKVKEFRGNVTGIGNASATGNIFTINTTNNRFKSYRLDQPYTALEGNALSSESWAWDLEETITTGSTYTAIVDNQHFQILDQNQKLVLEKNNAHNTRITNSVMTKDNLFYATHSKNDKEVKIWKLPNGELIDSFKEEIKSFTTDTTGQYIFLLGENHRIKVWDTTKQAITHSLKGHDSGIRSMNAFGDLAISTAWGECIVWSMENGSKQKMLDTGGKYGYFPCIEFSTDHRYVFIGTANGQIIKWDLLDEKTEVKAFSSGAITHLRMTNDGLLIAGCADGKLRFINSSDLKLAHTLETHDQQVTQLQLLDNDLIFSTSMDGSVTFSNLKTKKVLFRRIELDDENHSSVDIHPSGLFDADPKIMDKLYWTKGNEVIAFSQLKDRYWYPQLAKRVLSGEALPDVRNLNQVKSAPKVMLGKLENGKVPITLQKRDGGYGKVSIFINGKEVANDTRGSEIDTTLAVQEISYTLKDHPYLKNGNNTVVVKAASADGFVETKGEEIEIFLNLEEEAKIQPNFYGVVVGVGEYANEEINLKYTVKDAKAIAKAMELGAENLFGKEQTHIYSLTSADEVTPTKSNIKATFEEISEKATNKDVIVIYLSGHGVTWGGVNGDFYYLTSDATASNKNAYNDPQVRNLRTISTNEWVDWINMSAALKQVMIIDACGSGKAVDNLVASRSIEASQFKAMDRMKDRTGMYIISGCAADAVSYEASLYGQGLLTYSILQAMKGAALKEDKYIDIFTVLNHARETVPTLAEGLGGIQQPQLLMPKGGSFDIGILEDADKGKIPLAQPKRVFVYSSVINLDEGEDNLGLSDAIDKELEGLAARGEDTSIVFFNTKKYPNACKVSGFYSESEEGISFSMKLRCGQDKESFELSAKTKNELISKIKQKLTFSEM
ncbi:caspase family protein [Sediminitomix flava]|nr:caspase family protein [Sediminitomix flava]